MSFQSNPAALPVEVIGLIVDDLWQPFLHRGGADYQCPTLRTALYHLSLSARHLRDYCRRYLWHTIVVECNEAAPTVSPEYRHQMESLYQTLSALESSLPFVKRLELTFRCGCDLESKLRPGEYIPKILDIFEQLESLHFEGTHTTTLVCFTKSHQLDALLPCIQRNPLRELSIIHAHVTASLMSMLPPSLKQLVLNKVQPGYIDGTSGDDVPGEGVCPESLQLQVTYEYFGARLASLPPAFFKHLRFLDVQVQGLCVFINLHKHLLAYSQNIESLRIGYSGITSDDLKNRIRLLPSMLQQSTISPNLTKLTLEARDIDATDGRYPFEELVNAYLSHLNLRQSLAHLDIKATWYHCELVRGGGPGADWATADGLLSDETRFPHLKSVRLVLNEIYWHIPKHRVNVIRDKIPQREVEKVQELRNVFLGCQRRDLDLDINWKSELETPY